MAGRELIADRRIEGVLENVAHAKTFDPCELVAGINIPARDDSDVLRSRAAPAKPLVKTRTGCKIYHKMEKVYRLLFLTTGFQIFRKPFILRLDCRKMFGKKFEIAGCYHRLNRNLVEPKICNCGDIFGKIQIPRGKCPANIVFFLSARSDKPLCILYNLIVTPWPAAFFRSASWISFRPSMLMTRFFISLLIKSIISSVT